MRNEMTPSLANLSGRTAVVIGGTSGIGRVLALGLAAVGADVVASSRRVEQVEATAREIESLSRQTLRATCDVCDRASLEILLAKTIENLGKVDILVNCAGKIERAPTIDFPEESWRDILEINLTGTLRGCQIFGRHMLERGYGRIINLASLNTFVSLTQVAAYAASKGGVLSLTHSLALEYSKQGLRAVNIQPGGVATALALSTLDKMPADYDLGLWAKQTPLLHGKVDDILGDPSSVAAVIAMVASEDGAFITGTEIRIDGGAHA